MDKSRTILREGYVYMEEKSKGQNDVLYLILKTSAVCFHRRKVHKRHTPLGLLRLEEIHIETKECTEDETDLNSNRKRFSWQITTKGRKLCLYCGTSEERTAWISAIKEAQQNLSHGPTNGLTNGLAQPVCRDFEKSDSVLEHQGEDLKVENKRELAAAAQGRFDGGSLDANSVYNFSHTEAEEKNNGVGTKDAKMNERKPVRRRRSRSLSEIINQVEPLEHEVNSQSLKSSSAPPYVANSKRGFKTVDKLIDVHSIWCRQLVRWI